MNVPPTVAPHQSESPSPHRRRCAAFDPRRLHRQVVVDACVRWAVFVCLGGCIAVGSIWEIPSLTAGFLVMIIAGAWIAVSVVSARVVQQLSNVTELIAHDPDEAEAALAAAIGRQPLQRSVRLLLYHRLAMLRHRQQRLAESAAICQALLSSRRGLAREVRVHLLLMLVEAHLQFHDLGTAYQGLTALHRIRLNLLEQLQRMAMQVRYEVLAGHHRAALDQIDRTLQLVELMPAAQCGMLHLLLATAAERSANTSLAAWLRSRAELLCTPEQIAEFASNTHGAPGQTYTHSD